VLCHVDELLTCCCGWGLVFEWVLDFGCSVWVVRVVV